MITPLTPAELSWNGAVPEATAYGDIYFSREDGLAESDYVFLQGNRLAERFAALTPGQHFIIGEAGFGTGLNFLLTLQRWHQTAPADARLTFISTELHPLTPADLQRALAHWPQLAAEAQLLLANYPVLTPGYHLLSLTPQVDLLLLLGDARDTLPQLADCQHQAFVQHNPWQVDAWFLDGFAPAKNPALWQRELLGTIASLSKRGTTLATFTAVGQLRRDLQALGFEVQKIKGYGRKRDMQIASYQGNSSVLIGRHHSPWLSGKHLASSRPNTCAVIGAGLAGSHIARALAERGWQVRVFDQATHIAAGASGNPEGALYTRLSAHTGQLNEYSLAALAYAQRHYRRPFLAPHFRQCGLLQQADYDPVLEQLLQSAGLGQWLDAGQASTRCGLTLNQGGWWLPQAGSLQPRNLCKALLQHPNIELCLSTSITQLQERQANWQLQTADTTLPEHYGHVVCACALAIESLTDCAPLRPVRGQISSTSAPPTFAPHAVICGDGYATPNGVFGASFVPNDTATELRSSEREHNLQKLHDISAPLAQDWRNQALTDRASLRAASRDYLPFAGPAPVNTIFRQRFAPLAANARKVIDQRGEYRAGLWVFGGLGGRGLTYAPLAAALLCSQMENSPRPLPRSLHEALSPARQLIKAIIRGQ